MLTTKQAGKALGVNDSRIRQLILAGRLKATKLGHMWIIQKKDLYNIKKVPIGNPNWLKKGGK